MPFVFQSLRYDSTFTRSRPYDGNYAVISHSENRFTVIYSNDASFAAIRSSNVCFAIICNHDACSAVTFNYDTFAQSYVFVMPFMLSYRSCDVLCAFIYKRDAVCEVICFCDGSKAVLYVHDLIL